MIQTYLQYNPETGIFIWIKKPTRNVTIAENCLNKVRHRQGKLVGASYHKRDKVWEACIRKGKEYKYLGRFNSEQEAHNAYINYSTKLTEEVLTIETI